VILEPCRRQRRLILWRVRWRAL